MALQVDADNLTKGLLGLLVALVEIVRDVLGAEAVKRMKGGLLSAEEMDRLGRAVMELDRAIEQLKSTNDLHDVVRRTRKALDDLVDDSLTRIASPRGWKES